MDKEDFDTAMEQIFTGSNWEFVAEEFAREFSPSKRERRERMATAAMQGLLANLGRVLDPDDVALAAVEYADALMMQLNDEKEK